MLWGGNSTIINSYTLVSPLKSVGVTWCNLVLRLCWKSVRYRNLESNLSIILFLILSLETYCLTYSPLPWCFPELNRKISFFVPNSNAILYLLSYLCLVAPWRPTKVCFCVHTHFLSCNGMKWKTCEVRGRNPDLFLQNDENVCNRWEDKHQ